MHSFVFQKTIKVVFGRNSIKQIEKHSKTLGSKPLFVIGDQSLKKNKKFTTIKKLIKKKFIHINIEKEPEINYLKKIIKNINKNKIDSIIAIGGGSVIDSAKIFSVCLKKKITPELINKKKIDFYPILTVPTIPGSSSELSGSAVVISKKTKYDVNGIFPKICILDSTLMDSLDRKKIFSGISDAFSHVSEHYFNSSNFSDLIGTWSEGFFKGLIEVSNKLKKNYNKREVNDEVLLSCSFSPKLAPVAAHGNAIWEIHPIAHALGSNLKIPHRIIIGICLQAWFYAKRKSKKKKFKRFLENVLNNKYKYIDTWHKHWIEQHKLPSSLGFLKLSNQKKNIINKLIKVEQSCFSNKELTSFLKKIYK
tara:strand:+ start:1167 stop:2261 length:1095 start_codon:yes stop_codon:yes gene_type:complete